jgi:excisionase family DNA binding protein
MDERYYTVPETARLLRRTIRTVRRWIALGQIETVEVMVSPNEKRILIPSAEVEKYLPGGRFLNQTLTVA